MNQPTHTGTNPVRFVRTPYGARKEAAERLARTVLGLMALCMVLPLVAIVTHLFVRAWPSLSPEFLPDIPRDHMRAGGIWPAFVGTLYLVGIRWPWPRPSESWPPCTSTNTPVTTGSPALCNWL